MFPAQGIMNDEEIDALCTHEGDPLIAPYDFDMLQGHSYDCKLSEESAFPSAKHKSWNRGKFSCISLESHAFGLFSTKEYFKLPNNVAGFVCGKSSIGRNGLQIENAGYIDAGFHGNITLELFNMRSYAVELVPDMPICQVIFFWVKEAKIKPYCRVGHYNGQTGPTIPKYRI